jgi:hypothetical protein
MERSEETEERTAPTGAPSFLNVPTFSVSSFTTMGQPHELGIFCSGVAPALDAKGVLSLAYAPRVFLSIPVAEAKELAALINQYVEEVERTQGEIKTDFLESMAKS